MYVNSGKPHYTCDVKTYALWASLSPGLIKPQGSSVGPKQGGVGERGSQGFTKLNNSTETLTSPSTLYGKCCQIRHLTASGRLRRRCTLIWCQKSQFGTHSTRAALSCGVTGLESSSPQAEQGRLCSRRLGACPGHQNQSKGGKCTSVYPSSDELIELCAQSTWEERRTSTRPPPHHLRSPGGCPPRPLQHTDAPSSFVCHSTEQKKQKPKPQTCINK